jgi:Ca2+-transporting ATPase
MFERKKIDECEKELKTNFDKGLNSEEAKCRLERNGKNALDGGKKKNIFSIFISQLNDPMIYILFVAIIISISLKEISDAIIIIAVVLLNGIIGTVQESKAEKALEALKKMSSPTCVVKRDGHLIEIKAEELVVGDVVEIEAGRTIPADLRIIESNNLKIEEASLTGESVPVIKDANVVFDKEIPLGDRINMAYMSTNVVNGRGAGVVTAVGMNTQVGRIASLIKNEKDEMTPLQKRLADLGKLLGILAVALCVALFVIALVQGRDVKAMLISAISLAVAAIPEGLPAVVTIVLALGVQRMVKVNTIVRKLPSVETLGAVSVVCSDKTGTLTQNKMTVEKMYCSNVLSNVENAKGFELLVEGFVLCNDAVADENGVIGDPTEIALIELGNKFNLLKSCLNKEHPRVNELPFDSDRKMMSTQHDYGKVKKSYTKGAVDNIIKRCTKIYDNGKIREITKADLEMVEQATREMSLEALRVLALGYKETGAFDENNLIFVGMVGMIDPPRPEAKTAVNTFKEAGITTIMITGDHKDTAFAIAKDLGIAESIEQCINGEQLDKLTQEELNEKVLNLRVFARVSPEHKVMIVKAFKANDQIVSMTGDGVNDAPSLKAADIGIAMGITGTDVAKGAADMVLSDDNFASIEKAIEEGRTIYANIKKSVLFLLSSNFAEVIAMFLAILAGFPVPLIAIHILWVNLLTDSVPALALGSDPKENDVMKDKPRNPKDSLFAHGGMKFTLFYGVLIALLTLTAFISIPCAELGKLGTDINYDSVKDMLNNNSDVLMRAQTFAFTTLAVSELFHAVGMRNLKKSFIRKDIFNNKLMVIAVVLGVALQVLVTEVPFLNDFFKTTKLEFAEWCFILGVSLMTLIAHEILVLGMKIKNRCKTRK